MQITPAGRHLSVQIKDNGRYGRNAWERQRWDGTKKGIVIAAGPDVPAGRYKPGDVILFTAERFKLPDTVAQDVAIVPEENVLAILAEDKLVGEVVKAA